MVTSSLSFLCMHTIPYCICFTPTLFLLNRFLIDMERNEWQRVTVAE